VNQLIDDLARELASPTSRRGAIRLIGGAMLGFLFTSWKPASLQAQTCNPPCSGKKGTCCTTGNTPFCVTTGKTCCGNTKCGGKKICCSDSASPFCTTAGKTCCGKKGCKPGEVCCALGCCQKGQYCVSGRCQASNG